MAVLSLKDYFTVILTEFCFFQQGFVQRTAVIVPVHAWLAAQGSIVLEPKDGTQP